MEGGELSDRYGNEVKRDSEKQTLPPPPQQKQGGWERGGGPYKTFIIPGKSFNVDDIKRLKRGGGGGEFRVKGGEERRMHIKVGRLWRKGVANPFR